MWTVTIGQLDDPVGVRIQERVVNIRVTESSSMLDFSVTVKNPTADERIQPKGRIDSAIICIERRGEVVAEGFIEDVESGADYVKYTGRSFLVLTGYSTSSKTTRSTGKTDAEYSDDCGYEIIESLISKYCAPNDNANEIGYNISLKDINGEDVVYGGEVKLHGKKVYQIIKEMCQSYGHDLWSSTKLDNSGNITSKIINVGIKQRGSVTSPYKTFRGGIELKNIPVIKYKSSETINRIRVIGGGTGKDKVSEIVEDTESINLIGVIEGEPYHNNMIKSVETARSVGAAIINDKKNPIEELHIELAMYVSDIQYGDWVNIIDTYSNIDITKRIKSITGTYSIGAADTMSIELGDKFDNYQNIIRDLTKGDVDVEPDMVVAGGSLRLTANDPPNDFVRIDPGDWYGTDGFLYRWRASTCTFWGSIDFIDPPYNPNIPGNYAKALVQIKDGAARWEDITYKTNMTLEEQGGMSKEMAELDTISADAGYTPVGEVILKCERAIPMFDNEIEYSFGFIYDITSVDEGGSYIYRDARPIVGSSSGSGGGKWAIISWIAARNIWTASTAYDVGSWVKPTNEPLGKFFVCISSQEPWESGTIEPLWPITSGTTIIDNNLVWISHGDGIIPDEILGIPDMDIWVTPVGNGVVYLG